MHAVINEDSEYVQYLKRDAEADADLLPDDYYDKIAEEVKQYIEKGGMTFDISELNDDVVPRDFYRTTAEDYLTSCGISMPNFLKEHRNMSAYGVIYQISRANCRTFANSVDDYYKAQIKMFNAQRLARVEQAQRKWDDFRAMVESLSFPDEEDFKSPLFNNDYIIRVSLPVTLEVIREKGLTDFDRDPRIEKLGHSGTTYYATLRNAKAILNRGWEAFIKEYSASSGILWIET